MRSDNTSGVTGVSWNKAQGDWQARIKVSGRLVHLGRFKKFEDAVQARAKANIDFGFHFNHGSAEV